MARVNKSVTRPHTDSLYYITGGFVLSIFVGIFVGLVFFQLNDKPLDHWTNVTVAANTTLVLFLGGFLTVGEVNTPRNFQRLYGVFGSIYIGSTLGRVGPGIAWEPWFFGVWTITSIHDQRDDTPIGKRSDGTQVPDYFIFEGQRALLVSELGEGKKAPANLTLDGQELVIPISGDYRVFDGAAFTSNEIGEITIQGELLTALRVTVAKFNYDNAVQIKFALAGLASGFQGGLVVRGEKGTLLEDIYGRPLLEKIEIPFEKQAASDPMSNRKVRKALCAAKRKIVKDHNRGRPVSKHKKISDWDNMTGNGALEFIFTAGNLVRKALALGAVIDSLQPRDATPSDRTIIAAAAKIKAAEFDKIAQKIRSGALMEATKELVDNGISDRDAAIFIARVQRGDVTQTVVEGRGDALQQLIAALQAGRS